MMKKAILIGMSGVGKTTLIQRLDDEELVYAKTQVVRHSVNFIDTPGEYLELRSLYRGLIISSADADEIGLVQDCVRGETWIPPSFATTFAKPIFGIVTKTDLATSPSQLTYARSVLQTGGAARVFEVSAVTGDGIHELLEYLDTPTVARPSLQSRAPRPARPVERGRSDGQVSSPEFGEVPAAWLRDPAIRDMSFGGAQ